MLKVLKVYYSFVFKKRFVFTGFILLVIISNILFSLNPIFYKQFVDFIPSLDQNKLLTILITLILVRFGGVIFDILAFIVGDYILFDAAKDARIKIFKHVQDLDFAFHSNKSTGSLISAFKRGDGAMFSFFHDIHVRIFGAIVAFLVMIYYLAELNLVVVLLVTLSLFLTVILAKFLVANNVYKRKFFNQEEDNISGIVTDNLINFETVKLFAKEKWEENRLKEAFKPWIKTLWGYGNSFRVIDATMGTLINLSIFAILYLTINQAVNLKLTVGEFVLITGFLSNFYPKLWDLVWSTRDLAKNYADIEKYFELLNHDIEVADPEHPISLKSVSGQVEFKNVSHSYQGGTKNAIKNLNLKIKAGESVAFVGRSGSGKTTITKLLMRFFDPEKGKILIDGIDIKKFTKSSLRGFFGVVPQEAVLFNNTIGYNINYGAQQGDTLIAKRVRKGVTLQEVARLANIADFIESLPNKYEANVGERGIKLSGGQKQRLAIARMIMSSPDIIIFDEATSHLDSESEKLIQDAFWKYAKDKTTIIIAHRLSTVAKADRIVVLEKGKLVEIGRHKDLIRQRIGLYKKLWNLQS